MAKCGQCEDELLPNKCMCQTCGHWNLLLAPVGGDEGTEAAQQAVDNSVTLDEVMSSDADRIQTGIWDYCWGTNDDEAEEPVYGIVRGSTTLIAGSPGAGKSTLMLQIARAVALTYAKVGNEVLYVASEEQLKQIKQRAIRLKFTKAEMKLIRMVPAMTGGVDLNVLLKRYSPPLTLLDSLKGMVGEDDDLAIKVCKILKEFAMAFNCPCIIATHVTKDDVMAGKMNLQHEVDTTMTFFPDTDRVGDNGEAIRILDVMKNRNGRAFISLDFLMTAKGLELAPEDSDDEE